MTYIGIGLVVIVIALIIKNKYKKSEGDDKKDISADTILPTPPKPPKGEEPK